MSKPPKIRAAGAVVLRGHGPDAQVLLIHRKRYDDWSLPKGKGAVDELAPQTAWREVLEETGVRVRLDLRLPSVRYDLADGKKVVKYWRAHPLDLTAGKPDGEADKIAWIKVAKALNRLDYENERETLEAALTAPPTTALLLVRHAKAMLRKNWSGADQKRRLTGRGRRQAKDLTHILKAFGVARLLSSSSTRCFETLRPYAEASRLKLVTTDVLTEEEGVVKPKEVRRFMAQTARTLSEPTALCGHRPVLPAMFEGLGLEPRPMLVAETIVVHQDAKGRHVAVEVHKPTG